MRILVLSFYYPPDLGPTSLRPKSIVDSLVDQNLPELKIDVLTTFPNRYHSHNIKKIKNLENNFVSIHRIKIPKHKNNFFDQSISFFYFAFYVQKFIINKKWDIVVSTSSRLMTASLAAYVAKCTKAKLYLDIRDLFVDIMSDLLLRNPLRILIPLLNYIEKKTLLSANKINIISKGFYSYFKKKYPSIKPTIYTNGIDEIFLNTDFTNKNKKNPKILYVGNIGEGQNLHSIIPNVLRELSYVNFKIIGDGSRKNQLLNNSIIKSQKNIIITNPVKRENLLREYRNSDILFLHLNDYQSLSKVLPSKIFEYAATGKPILAGVSGYAAKFLRNNIQGVEIFDPGDSISFILSVKKLLKGPKKFNRRLFCKKYLRKNIMKKMAKDILALNK